MKQPCPITAGHFERLCLSLWLIQDSNWKGRVLWKLSGGLATILQNWISCNEQKMREAHITRRGTSFYLLIFIEKIINRKIEHSQYQNRSFYRTEPLFLALLWYVVVSSPQHGEKTAFFSSFPLGGLHG